LSLYVTSNSLRELVFVKKMHKTSFFSQFKDIKLVLNQFCIWWRTLLASFLKFIGSGFQMIRLVSSANKTILLLLFVKESKSFMYRRKSKGHSINRWGTPWVILPQSETEVQ
jgi:hypothetical protein